MSFRGIFIVRGGYHQRTKLRVPAAEFQQTMKLLSGGATRFDFDSPVAPTAFKHRIDFEWFFAPIGDSLALVDGKGKAGVFHPVVEALGLF
jgi:hypothetical protein